MKPQPVKVHEAPQQTILFASGGPLLESHHRFFRQWHSGRLRYARASSVLPTEKPLGKERDPYDSSSCSRRESFSEVPEALLDIADYTGPGLRNPGRELK